MPANLFLNLGTWKIVGAPFALLGGLISVGNTLDEVES